MQNKIAFHYARDYLNQTLTWIYGQIKYNTQYTPVVLANKVANLDQFPCENVHCITKDLNKLQLRYNKMFHRFAGYYPYFDKQTAAYKPHVIHAHFGNIGYKALKLSKRNNIPLVTTFYGYDASALAQKPKYQQRFKTLFQEGDLFLAEGNHLRNTLISLGCPESKAKVFHLGVEVEKYPFRLRKPDTDNIKILFAASFVEKKGLEYAVSAFAIAHKKHPNIKLRIIGDGPEKTKINELIVKLGISQSVEMAGYVKYNQLIDELYNADIFIQPSITASDGCTEGGSPVCLLDAQATGAPIVATYHADIPEVVIHGKTGLLAPERNSEALAGNIIRLIDNPQLMAQYGQAGRMHVEENYNVKKQGEILAQLYNSVL